MGEENKLQIHSEGEEAKLQIHSEEEEVQESEHNDGICSSISAPVNWFKMLAMELHWSFVFGVVIVYGVSQGLGGAFSRISTEYYMKDVQKVQPSESQVYSGITSIPWIVKPLWGLLTDAVPILGYRRRPYFLFTVLPSQEEAAAKGAHIPSLSKLHSSVEQAVPQLDMKLEKLNISACRQPVIFPSHLQVPESLRSRLTFGSLDPQLDPSVSCGKDSIAVKTLPANDSTSMEVGSYQDASSEAQESDYPDNLLSHQHGSENISPFEVSGASPVYDPSKPEKCPPSAGSQLPLLQSPPDYSLGFVPPMLGPQLVCFEGPEQQGGNPQAPSTLSSNPPVAQPIGLGQSSASVPPHLFPLVRQPFPPNYMPYNPYIPHVYMPQSAHQFLGPSGFPQQPSATNFYMSPSVTAAGVKLPLPSLYKPTAIAGNLNHFGIPTGYSSFGSSTVSYSGTPALVCSASNENLSTPETKERNVYSMQKQNEDSHYKNSAPARDQSMLQTNYFYNIPQDQHVAVAPAHSSNSSFPGINPSQTIVAQSNVQPLAQQPQTVARSGDSGLPTSGAFQQPQANIHWNNKLLNRENI